MRSKPLFIVLVSVLCALAPSRSGAASLLDVWRAGDLNLNNGDTVGTWSSANNVNANANIGESPTFITGATPAGTAAVRFNGSQLMRASSPVGGRTAFSIAIVFGANSPGANNNGQWWGKTGMVDAEQGGVTSDWGIVLTETGQVGIGTGNGGVSTYSTGASLVGAGAYHVAVFTWGGGTQAVYVDDRAPVSQSGVSTTARNNAGIALGGILTGETNRRLNGDLVEVRFYDAALSSAEAAAVIADLRDTHIFGNVPRIFSFAAEPGQIYLGESSTLSWNVTNATSVVIDNGVGAVAAQGSALVSPTAITSYTLTASNPNGERMATATVMVDPGAPVAMGLSTNTPRNMALNITLTGFDPNGGVLTYSIVDPPAHGLLSGAAPNVSYMPDNNYDGPDSFTFRVFDGMFNSSPATVSIEVVPPATPPSGLSLSSTNIPAGAGPGAFIAALQAIDVNIPQGDTHTFALVSGFGDNAQFVISGNLLRAGPSFSGGLGALFHVRLRATDSSQLSVEQEFLLTVAEARRAVIINEILYNSDDNTIRQEFIELYNPTDAAIDLSQWRLRGGIDYLFPSPAFIAPGGYLVVAEDPATIQNLYEVSAFGPWSGGLNNEGEEVTLRDPLNEVIDRVDFRSEFPWPVAANGEGPSMELVNAALDNDLGSSWRSSSARRTNENVVLWATPGVLNSVFASNAAPNIRQVNHSPDEPKSADEVAVSCKVTDPEGVGMVSLAYQVVLPGDFIPSTLPLTASQLNSLNSNSGLTNMLNPAFEASSNWASVIMHDDGLNGDEQAGDDVYSVVLPRQAHRTLVRYRITCSDALGASRRAPFEDDPSLNFAYFVYDRLPAYQGFPAETLASLPVYTLVTRDSDMNECAAWYAPWSGTHQLPQDIGGTRNEGRIYFNWEGAMVYDGRVYDHVKYRLRGANGRYQPGKRNFRVRFNSGSALEAKDQFGKRFPTKWRELTTGKGQSNRGSESYALNEVVNLFLWNKAGVPAPGTFHFHFRVVRGASEQGADQYSGDFWGLNWAQEKYDVNFLDSHAMPKGNLYKLVDNYVLGVDERRYQAPFAVTNAADFFTAENDLTGFQSLEWLRAHANYTNWYRYFTIAEAIRHYDTWPSANKNGAWYFQPPYTPANDFLGRLMQLPYDTTDTWGPTWNTGEDLLFNGAFPSSATGGDSGGHSELQMEYRNVVREMRDLLFQPDQINGIIDAFAAPLLPFSEADRTRWRAAPAPASYNSLFIPSSPGVTAGLAGYVQDMKNFMFAGGNNAWWIDRTSVAPGGWVTRLDQIATDPSVPNRPTLSYIGADGFPVDGLIFASSPFSDPEGDQTFAGIQWRVAEITFSNTPVANIQLLKLEWDATWDSGESDVFASSAAVPAGLLSPERFYRARVRHKDNTGRWSRWSEPIEFRPRAVDVFQALRRDLVISEIMYHPPGEGAVDGDDLEFLELRNKGGATLNLTGLFFSDGIDFTFTNNTRLEPGELFLLARNPAALAVRYPGVVVNGTYSGRLDNGGERLAISHVVAGELVVLEYDDRAPWPVTPDGFGFSLVRRDDGSYGASATVLGGPGMDQDLSNIGGVVINEILSASTAPLKDSIELLNVGNAPLDISGWYLTDDPNFPQKFRIPSRAPLLPGEFALYDEDQFNPGVGFSFSLSSFGDDAYLFSADPSGGQLTGYSHGFTFGAAQDGVSFGRYVNSVGQEQFPLQRAASLNASNSGPRVGPVVISEIHYHPRSNVDEFIELHNITAAAAPLFDASSTNTWSLSGAGFSFPTNISIPANGYVLLVNDTPTAFRARFNVPAGVRIFQYTGNLQDSGENLELQAPDTPTAGGIPYFAVDVVRYNDRRPWPLAADGAGASLQRIDPAAYGNDPVNWAAALPTPGAPGIGGNGPVFTSQPQPVMRTNAVGGTALFSVAAIGVQPIFYQWRFNGANLDGQTNATLMLAGVQLESGGAYSAVAFNQAGSAESQEAMLTVRVGATITTQPLDVTLRVQPDPIAAPATNATFTAAAITFNPPLSYQWQFNGMDIPGATGPTLTITNVQPSDEGAYVVVVHDAIGEVPSQPARLLPLVRPLLVQWPDNLTAAPGDLISVSAEASGSPLPFAFEWRRLSAVIASNVVSGRFGFFSFTNNNAPGSTIQYRVVVRAVSGLDNKVFTVTTLVDTDGDGMPDSWEDQFGLDSNDPSDRGLDLDMDGATNAQEYGAGTDPTDPNSFLQAQLSIRAGQPAVRFGALARRTYTVEYTDALGIAPWQKLADILDGPENRIVEVIDPAWTSSRIYRIATPRQP